SKHRSMKHRISIRSTPTRRSSDLYRTGIAQFKAALPALLPPILAETAAQTERDFVSGGTPPALARTIAALPVLALAPDAVLVARSGEHTSELQSREKIVCRLLLEK